FRTGVRLPPPPPFFLTESKGTIFLVLPCTPFVPLLAVCPLAMSGVRQLQAVPDALSRFGAPIRLIHILCATLYSVKIFTALVYCLLTPSLYMSPSSLTNPPPA